MSRPTYSYQTGPAPPPPRQSANHGTSSAFSSSANPDEDWTQISDLAERRRIQNRIAQRNYRKKLKRRLEDLERRAGSPSASPPQSYEDLKQQPERKPSQSTKQSQPTISRTQKLSPRATYQQNPYTPPLHPDDDLFTPAFSDRDGSHTPPLFSYASYPPPSDMLYPSYPYRQDSYDYLPPATLPSMHHFGDALHKRDDDMNPFGMSYAAMAGLDIQGQPSQQHYDDPHTPPLCHSFDQAAQGGAYAGFPGTPCSLPPSPPGLGL